MIIFAPKVQGVISKKSLGLKPLPFLQAVGVGAH
jgi:hypothetical protein